MMYTAEAFFGEDKVAFSGVRDRSGCAERNTRLRAIHGRVDDTIDARVYQGIHFRAGDVQGAGIGKDVAHWLDKNYFQPVN